MKKETIMKCPFCNEHIKIEADGDIIKVTKAPSLDKWIGKSQDVLGKFDPVPVDEDDFNIDKSPTYDSMLQEHKKLTEAKDVIKRKGMDRTVFTLNTQAMRIIAEALEQTIDIVEFEKKFFELPAIKNMKPESQRLHLSKVLERLVIMPKYRYVKLENSKLSFTERGKALNL